VKYEKNKFSKNNPQRVYEAVPDLHMGFQAQIDSSGINRLKATLAVVNESDVFGYAIINAL